MPRRLLPFIAILSLAGITAAPLAGQVSTPLGQIPVPRVGGALGDLAHPATETLGQTSSLAQRQARSLLRARDQRLDRLLRANRDRIERDAAGNLARRSELLVTDVDGQSLPVLDAVTAGSYLRLSLEQGRWVLPGVDLTALATGLFMAWGALRFRGDGKAALAVRPTTPSTGEPLSPDAPGDRVIATRTPIVQEPR